MTSLLFIFALVFTDPKPQPNAPIGEAARTAFVGTWEIEADASAALDANQSEDAKTKSMYDLMISFQRGLLVEYTASGETGVQVAPGKRTEKFTSSAEGDGSLLVSVGDDQAQRKQVRFFSPDSMLVIDKRPGHASFPIPTHFVFRRAFDPRGLVIGEWVVDLDALKASKRVASLDAPAASAELARAEAFNLAISHTGGIDLAGVPRTTPVDSKSVSAAVNAGATPEVWSCILSLEDEPSIAALAGTKDGVEIKFKGSDHIWPVKRVDLASHRFVGTWELDIKKLEEQFKGYPEAVMQAKESMGAPLVITPTTQNGKPYTIAHERGDFFVVCNRGGEASYFVRIGTDTLTMVSSPGSEYPMRRVVDNAPTSTPPAAR